MNWLFEKCFNPFEFACILVISALLSASWYWLLLIFPVVFLNIIGETYCKDKEETK
jgi:hypothetical protein